MLKEMNEFTSFWYFLTCVSMLSVILVVEFLAKMYSKYIKGENV